MALSHSPLFVMDQLVLHLDPANSKSYNNQTIWYDLSGKGNHATMIGTPPYDPDGGGCFNIAYFAGGITNSNPAWFFNKQMMPLSGPFTISCWVKNPAPSVAQTGMFANTGGAFGFRFGVGLNGVYYLIGPGYSESTLSFTTSIPTTTWNHVVCVYDRTGSLNAGSPQMQLYLNGVYQTNISLPAQTAMPDVIPGLIRAPCCQVYYGKFSMFSVHAKALTANEALQNYNAHRGRYGV
jgi:hypothetical protein